MSYWWTPSFEFEPESTRNQMVLRSPVDCEMRAELKEMRGPI